MSRDRLRILYVEPFEAGSHARFGATLRRHLGHELVAWTMPGRHWKWRMRGAGLWLAEQKPAAGAIDVLLASSFTPLADLVALRPDIAGVPRVLYFHENQWEYPDRARQERDHHLAFTQVVSAAAADLCLFNSQYNRDTFLRATRAFIQRMPDARPTATVEALALRCEVLPVPVEAPSGRPADSDRSAPLQILWNHRWEHDKRPEAFFTALEALAEGGADFRIAVCGQAFGTVPAAFDEARTRWADRIAHWGPIEDRTRYESLLGRCDVVLSTAAHEFFGMSIVEAALAGCRPIVPDRLAYPEVVPRCYRYRDDDELLEHLRTCCARRAAGQPVRFEAPPSFTRGFLPERVVPRLDARLRELVLDQRAPR